jgi:uncharacterized protein (PEP-CTERM system associated)
MSLRPILRGVSPRPVARHGGPRTWSLTLLAALISGLSAGAWAQGRGWTVTPGFAASQVVTDNRNLSDIAPQSDAITVLTPSVRLGLQGARAQLSLDYSLNALLYARDSSANDLQNALRASASAELVPEHAFIAAQASISRQSVSALQGFSEPQLGTGALGPSGGGFDPAIDANRTEVRSFSISPSLRGRPFGMSEFTLGLDSSFTDGRGGSAGDSSSHRLGFSLGDQSRVLGWGVFGSRTLNDFRDGRKTTSDTAGLRLSYAPWPELSVFVSGGLERNDVLTAEARQTETWGGGLSWRPGPRTQLALQANRQFFGNGWSLSASHRLRRAVFSYGDARNVTGSTSGALNPVSAYDLFFQQFASIEPDPARRDVLVRDFLLASGLDPNERINAGFLLRALSVQRSRNLAMSMSGQRTSLVLSAFATSTRRIDRVSTAFDDLSSVDLLRQHGLTASVSHRLTPASSLVFSGGAQRTQADGGFAGSALKFASLSWAGSLGLRTSVSLTARHSAVTGIRPYDVNTLNATLNHRF